MTAGALNVAEVVAPAGSISVRRVGKKIVTVELAGEIDLALADALRETVVTALNGHRGVIVDLRQTTFIDASIVGALIGCRREADARGAGLVLQLATAEIVERVLQLTRIEDAIPCGRTREEVVEMLSNHRGA